MINDFLINDYQLSGRNVLITGVSRSAGIGAAVAGGFASLGANVFTTYFRPYDDAAYDDAESGQEDARLIIEDLRSRGVKADGFEADLSEIAAPKAVFDLAEEALGQIDILVNNAACDYPCDIYSLTPALLDAHYWVNLRGTTLLSAEFATRHDGGPGGRLINLTSGQAIDPMENNLPYAMTKGAIEVLTKALSISLRAKGITVNAVDPGGTDTGWMSLELIASIKEKALYGRVGMPQDAVRLVLFLASAQAEWITGQVFHSRGGL